MGKTTGRELYKELEAALTDKGFLRETGLTKKWVLSTMSAYGWRSICQQLVTTRPMTCMKVYNAIKPTMDSKFEEPLEGWLKNAFDYTLTQLFPEADDPEDRNLKGRTFFFTVLEVVLKLERESREFSPTLDMELLDPQVLDKYPAGQEYQIMLTKIKEKHLYSFMRIAAEITPYNTWGHICGVHFVAMHMAKQLEEAGVPIDLALTSGAAASHDIGKFGVRPNEANRIPYLHYYYTVQCMTREGMPLIGHIGSNHSTWDLELENLSVENLLLIYADFRVKSTFSKTEGEVVNFYSLDDAFHVILDKLDNVDDAKRDRYTRVYQKLHDFENYMIDLGASTDITICKLMKTKAQSAVLLNGNQAVNRLKYLAIEHNIKVMSKFNSHIAFGNLLEDARSEKQWKNIRAYMNTLQEYFTYMTQKQKQMTMGFLFELLAHREGDIRRQGAQLIGQIIATYDEKYRKELPNGVEYTQGNNESEEIWKEHIYKIIHPDLKATEQQCKWIGHTLSITLDSLLKHTSVDEGKIYLKHIYDILPSVMDKDDSMFLVINALFIVPERHYNKESFDKILDFASKCYEIGSIETKVAALRLVKNTLEMIGTEDLDNNVKSQIMKMTNSENIEKENASVVFLKYRILKAIDEEALEIECFKTYLYKGEGSYSDIFRENLKVVTPWIIKVSNIEFLLNQLNHGLTGEVFYIATHLSNLLKVSERVSVRHSAGQALIKVFSHLNMFQKNEIAVELSKGLEIGDYQFSKYIPGYLGQLVLSLHPNELDEMIADLGNLLDSGNDRVASVILDTLGEVLKHYGQYSEVLGQTKQDYLKRKEKIIGMIMGGMADYHQVVSQEAFMVLGQHIFGSNVMSLEEKYDIFRLIFKKMLILAIEENENQLTFFNNAAALNHIYRFISDYSFYKEDINITDNQKVAFFPGTFDPFSRSHKAIVTTIRDMGYEVYLALDEFSWSKRTQPRKIRSKIINMSVANERDVYLFPDNQPVNIANPKDLEKLKEIFKGRMPYIVVGSDVVANASSYRMDPEEHSIHSLNHIIFNRDTIDGGDWENEDIQLEYRKSQITGDLVELTLPTYLEDISSSKIRDNIDSNRDISSLVDPIVQNYIYDMSLYMRAPLFKYTMAENKLHFASCTMNNGKVITLSDGVKNGKVIGSVFTTQVITANLYDEFQDQETTAYIRENALGKILVVKSFETLSNTRWSDLGQLLLTETLSDALKEDFTYCIFHPRSEEISFETREVLTLQGFKEIITSNGPTGIYAVDMRNPVVVFQNMDTVLKDPFDTNPTVREILVETHKKLQRSITNLYPNSLVLSFNSDIMYHKLIDKVSKANGVPNEPLKKRKLGPYMCVPFGRIMKTTVFPNTITKTLHTEKAFTPSLDHFLIKEYPYYASIDDQVKTIKSFDKPVVLVDDLLHKGYRMRSLDPVFKDNEIEVERLIVGLLSGRGKDLMTVQGREVESVYFVPNLRAWFVESGQYPFMGGDGVLRNTGTIDDAFTAINLILPYVNPGFLSGQGREAVFEFSRVCMENARDIWLVVEKEYQNAFGRKLTLGRMSEAILFPRLPDVGQCLDYDRSMAPSEYIESDIERLLRLKGVYS